MNFQKSLFKTNLNKFPNTSFTAVIGGREFEMNDEVQKRVIKSNPDILLSRSGSINFERYNFKKKVNYKFFTFKEAFLFQSQFFKFHIFDTFIKEFSYKEEIIDKVNHIVRSIKHGTLTGVSTGFFSILYALKFHPKSDIIVSGIGMSIGGHFYNKNSTKYNNRSKVDKALMKNLKKNYKDRLYTLDDELNINTKVKLFKSETF